MGLKTYALAAIGGAALVAAGWAAWNWHGTGQYKAGYAQALADTKAQADAQALASASQLAALEHAHNEIERLKREKENALAAAVDAGRVRLRVNATCPGVPKAADTSVGAGTRPELDASARQDYLALRSGVVKIQQELELCRAAVRELTTRAPDQNLTHEGQKPGK